MDVTMSFRPELSAPVFKKTLLLDQGFLMCNIINAFQVIFFPPSKCIEQVETSGVTH